MLVPFVVGGLARSAASTILFPINLVRMRLQMKTYTEQEMKSKNLKMTHDTAKTTEVAYKGMTDAVVKIYRNEGVAGFYKGLTPNIIKIFPTSGLFFVAYEAALANL